MFCKNTQLNIDALLRLRSNEDLCLRPINQVMENNNKIASVQSNNDNNKVGELREFIVLLKGLTH